MLICVISSVLVDRGRWKISDYDFPLPKELIAQYPLEKRADSRLMILYRRQRKIEHRKFTEILEYLHSGDILVVNQTKVIPARLFGYKEKTKGKVEIFLLREKGKKLWEALIRPSHRAKINDKIIFGNGVLQAEIVNKGEMGKSEVRFICEDNFYAVLEELGTIPLPLYIKRKAEKIDKERYQTVYAQTAGAVAAPTAGLHFSQELLEKIKQTEIKLVSLVLHTGLGTFQPIRVEDISQHKMEPEYYEISEETATAVNEAKRKKHRVIAVGTTTVRALETSVKEENGNWSLIAGKGWTNKFIHPPYEFRIVDALLTNFHLPRSTLFVLVSTFAGREIILEAYKEAIKEKYRFYSYGDAMLIL
ncbi:MAG: tRNA preQ1(34) S-adenosylmethionine ribosyltransferase-isomerase QueA [Candidatus Edwardsbacteria bacterium]